MMNNTKVPWIFSGGRTDLFNQQEHYFADDNAMKIRKEAIETYHLIEGIYTEEYQIYRQYANGMVTLRRMSDKHNDEMVRMIWLRPAIFRFHEIILRAAQYYHLRYVSIGDRDLIGFGGIRIGYGNTVVTDPESHGRPAAWKVAELIGIFGGWRRGAQCQIVDLLSEYPELYGTYDSFTGVCIGPSFSLTKTNLRMADNPIQEGNIPDFDSIRV